METGTTNTKDDNTVFIGKKGTMGYVLAVVTQFNNGAEEVAIKRKCIIDINCNTNKNPFTY